MTGLLDKNINFLKQSFPDLLNYILSSPGGRCKLERAKNGSQTLTYNRGGETFYLHSRYNPERESEKITTGKNTAADHIVVLGLGLGYHLEQIMKSKSPLSRVLLIEPDPEIVKCSLETLDWQSLLECPNFYYVFGESFEEIAHSVYPFTNIVTLEHMEYIELPSETRILTDFFLRARQVIDNELQAYVYDFKTRMAESAMLPRNLLKNLPLILETRPVEALKNRFSGCPGFIVSAGPSLDKNVLLLKKIRDRGLIISVDTALKPLLKRSIQPHFTVAGDPSHKNYLHLLGAEKEMQHFIAAEAGIAHQVFHDFKDELFTLSVGKPMVRMLEAHSQPLGELEAWGSVISIAVEMAVFLGLNPIVFVGQDFAFTDTRNHCRGTSWEENQLETTRNLDDMQRYEKNAITGNRKTIETDDIYGNKTFTSDRMVLYKNYVARLVKKHAHLCFINASQGGIFSEISQMPLHQVLVDYVYGKPAVDLGILAGIPTLEKRNVHSLTVFFKEKITFFKEYQGNLDKVLNLLENQDVFTADAALPVLETADLLKNYLYRDAQNGELVEIWSLTPIYRFLKEFKRLEETRELSENYIEANIHLYCEYFHGIKPLIRDIIERLTEAVEKLAG